MINELLLRVEYQGTVYDLIVDSDVPLRIDMSAVESQELGKFFGIGSQTFSLPGTKETNRFFNYAYDVSTDDIPAFYNTLDCSVVLNGETVLIGSLQLVQVISNDEGFVTYEVQVVDKVLQFEESLASKLIKDADFSAYDHTLTAANITASWDDNLLGGAILYPIIDYGRTEGDVGFTDAPVFQLTPITGSIIQGGFIGDVASPAQLKQFQPAIKTKSVLDVIFDQVGFSYTGSFTETQEFNDLYILNKPNEGLGVGSGVPSTFKAELTSNQTVASVNSTTQVRTAVLAMSQEISDPSNSYNPGTYTYVVPTTGDYIFNSSIYFVNPANEQCDVTVKVNLYAPGLGAVQASSSLDLNYQDNDFQTLNLSHNINVAAGTQLQTQVVLIYNGGGGTSNNLTIFDNSSTFFSQTTGPVTYEGVTVDMSKQWPSDTKSIDIIRGLLQQFNLVMIPEVGNKSVIRIEQFDTWIRSGEVKDWTSKYDTAKRVAINHTVDELPKEVFFKAEKDADRLSKATIESDPGFQYGTLRALADNTISQGTSDINTYFAPIVLGGAVNFAQPDSAGNSFYFGEYPLNTSTTFVIPHLYKFENSSQVSYSFKPRLGFKVQGQIPTGKSIFIKDGVSYIETTGTYTTLGNVNNLPVIGGVTPDLHFNNTYTTFTNAGLNLNGGVSNFNKYWKTYYDSLYWIGSKKVTMDLFFNEYEYKDIQLNDRILIKGQAYRINKISGFNVSHRDVVTVELIKLYPAYWQL